MNPAKKTDKTRIKKVSKIDLKPGLSGNLDPLLIWNLGLPFDPDMSYKILKLEPSAKPYNLWKEGNYDFCHVDLAKNLVASGPYGLIFASFVPFFFDIPVSTRFRVFGVRFSDKSFIYLAGLQLLLSSWKRSILPGVCGILAGFIYRLNILRIRKAKRNYPSSMPSSAMEPSEDSIATLVSMGFDRNNARQALVQARNDVNVATNILLEAQSH
ncbi:hypothetical protein L484_014698 [Morus notabilis]|uniref:UBA domain-containing protein n=1 Tax=Morus notabilis TaxID=981085 RepID=W9SBZ3_9ROSA|nr:hypothetical protein L484_014698 [Morus notabilis]